MENLFRTVDTDPFVFCAWSSHASLSSNWRNERNEVEWLAESLSSCGSFEPSGFYYPILYCVIALRFRLFYELISEQVSKVILQLNLKINKIFLLEMFVKFWRLYYSYINFLWIGIYNIKYTSYNDEWKIFQYRTAYQ